MNLFGSHIGAVPRAFLGVACAVSFCGTAGAQQIAPAAAAGTGLTIRLTAPAATPVGAAIYVAGTFNSWNPAAAGYRLTAQGTQYAIALPDSVRGPVEFKFTLGSWETVETTASGGDVSNRSATVPATGAATYEGTVAAWRTGPAAPRAHSATASVSILDTAFQMPQLGRTRRVWLYLPSDYATSARTYPVFYLCDGQNVFDAATSFAGEWGVDETLDSLHAAGDEGVIVVAVDNGGTHRMDEYQPWPSTDRRFGGGEGAKYVDFIVQTLKPYVDTHYRTRPERVNTGIGGSSLGGIISLYAALQYPDVFGRALVFSAPIFFEPQLFTMARAYRPRGSATRFYFDTGLEEGATELGLPYRAMAHSLQAMVDTLAAAGVDTAADVRALLPADGAHSEWFWRREFPAAYRWLFTETARTARP
jgi:predicted alpha/beta superfamily hydrolase